MKKILNKVTIERVAVIYLLLNAILSFNSSALFLNSVRIILILIIIYKSKLTKQTVLIFTFLILVYLVDLQLNLKYFKYIIYKIVFIIYILLPAYVLGINIKNYKKLLDEFYKISIIIFLLIIIELYVNSFKINDYMVLGMNLTIPTLVIINRYFEYRKYKDLILSFFCSMILIVFGNRSAFLVVLVYILIYLLINKLKIFTFIISLISLMFYWKKEMINFIVERIREINLNSYALKKLDLMLTEGVQKSSSGRDYVYKEGIEMFFLNPIYGSGVGYYPENNAFKLRYVHNIFLQILIEYGLIGIIITILLLLFFIFKYIRIQNKYKKIIISILICSQIRLLVSGDYLIEGAILFFIIGVLNNNLLEFN